MSAVETAGPTVAGPPQATHPSPEGLRAQDMSRIAQKGTILLGPLLAVLFIIGSVALAHFFPPALRANDSAQHVADYYEAHRTRIMLGMVFTALAYSLVCAWGMCIAAQTRRREGMFPVLTYAQIAMVTGGCATIVVGVVLWATAAYRAGDIDPQTTQIFNDAGWLLLLGTWTFFSVWAWVLAAAILLDKGENAPFPRWSGYAAIAIGVSWVLGLGCWFTFHGAFGWAGVLTLYLVFLDFGIFVVIFSVLTWKNVNRGHVHTQPDVIAR